MARRKNPPVEMRPTVRELLQELRDDLVGRTSEAGGDWARAMSFQALQLCCWMRHLSEAEWEAYPPVCRVRLSDLYCELRYGIMSWWHDRDTLILRLDELLGWLAMKGEDLSDAEQTILNVIRAAPEAMVAKQIQVKTGLHMQTVKKDLGPRGRLRKLQLIVLTRRGYTVCVRKELATLRLLCNDPAPRNNWWHECHRHPERITSHSRDPRHSAATSAPH